MPEDRVSTRGASFPSLALPDAVAIVRTAGKYSRSFSADALANYAGHSTSNSGPFRSKLAALRDWGLIAAGGNDSFSLTPLALQVVFPDSEQSERVALQESFMSSTLFETIYRSAAKGIELNRSQIANQAVTLYGVGIGAKDRFVRSFVESALFVGLASTVGSDRLVLHDVGSELEREPTMESEALASEVSAPSTAGRAASVSGDRLAPAMQQVWAFDGGSVVLTINSEVALSSDVFLMLPSIIKGIEDLVRVLSPESPRDSSG